MLHAMAERLLTAAGRLVTAADAEVLVVAAHPGAVSAPSAVTTDAIVAATAVTVATANAAAPSGAYVQADEATIATLANSLKVQLNAVIADNVETREVLAELLADVTALRVEMATLTTAHNTLVTDLTSGGVFS